ncbi:DUF1281 domain-containing protein [Providencia rettgeri]|uniref:DUF1281 domain-containing protein n=1 Tax=Providencia rettgeri TaxID=587 RepID=UPI0024AAC80B
MPNWCANRLEITLHNPADMPALKRWIKAEGGIPDWQTAIAQSIHLLLAGCAGILKPVKPIDFPPLPALTSHGETGIVSPGNIAFTYWVEMLMTAPDLDAACCQQIDQWYQTWLCEGTQYRDWHTLTDEQKAVLSPLLLAVGFDWLNRFTGKDDKALAAAWDDIQMLRSWREAMPMDMRDLLPTNLAAELNGFNGRLWQTPEDVLLREQWQIFSPQASSYHLYVCRYGVKWPTGIELRCSDDGDDTHLSVDFESPWSQPSVAVLYAVSARFNAVVFHTYAEAGCGFCGCARYDRGVVTYCESDDIEFSDEENEDGYHDVTGPSYILDNLPHYGG